MRRLDKRPEAIVRAAEAIKHSRIKSKEQFKKHFHNRILKKSLKKGDLVLMRN